MPDKLPSDDNGASFMLEENRRRDMGRLLGWTDEEIRNYHRSKDSSPIQKQYDCCNDGICEVVEEGSLSGGKKYHCKKCLVAIIPGGLESLATQNPFDCPLCTSEKFCPAHSFSTQSTKTSENG